MRTLVLPARLTFLSRGSTAIGLFLLIWTLAVWSLFGAAICRISAVQVARNGNVGLVEAIRFALARYVSFFTSPLLPFLGVVLIIFFCVLGSLILYIPYLEVIAGVVWILPLLAGFVIVAALLGLALGWPLMYAAIGAEATESFDALSRAFSYVLGRPWQYLFYTLLATIYGGIIMIFATIFAYGMVHMSQYAVSWGSGDTTSLYAFAPEAGMARSLRAGEFSRGASGRESDRFAISHGITRGFLDSFGVHRSGRHQLQFFLVGDYDHLLLAATRCRRDRN